MKRSEYGILACALAWLLCAPTSPAQDAVWTNVNAGTVVTGLWHNADNWDTGVPVAGQDARLTSTLNSYGVDFDTPTTTYTNATLYMGNSGGETVTLNVNGDFEGDVLYYNTTGRYTLDLGSGGIVNVADGASMRFNVPTTSSTMMRGTLNVYGTVYWHNPSGASGPAYTQLTVHDGGLLTTLYGSGTQQALAMGSGSQVVIEHGGKWTHSGRELRWSDTAAGVGMMTVRGAFEFTSVRELGLGTGNGVDAPVIRVETGGTFTVVDNTYGFLVARPGGTAAAKGTFVMAGGAMANAGYLGIGIARAYNRTTVSSGHANILDGVVENAGMVIVGGFLTTETGAPTDPATFYANLSGTLTQEDGVFRARSVVYVANGPSQGTVDLRGGDFIVTNAAGTLAMHVGAMAGANITPAGDGTLRLAGGHLTADRLVAVNGAGYSTIDFEGGELSTRSLTVTNGSALTVGDGVQAATLNLLDGTHTLADGLVINTNATLAAGGAGAIGTVAVSGGLTMRDGATLDADLAGEASVDTITVTGDVALDGMIDVAAIGGYTPKLGPEWTVVTCSGTMTGAIEPTDSGYAVSIVDNNKLVLTVLPKGTTITIR